MNKDMLDGYYTYWNCTASGKGSGVMICVKRSFVVAGSYSFKDRNLSGRVVVLDIVPRQGKPQVGESLKFLRIWGYYVPGDVPLRQDFISDFRTKLLYQPQCCLGEDAESIIVDCLSRGVQYVPSSYCTRFLMGDTKIALTVDASFSFGTPSSSGRKLARCWVDMMVDSEFVDAYRYMHTEVSAQLVYTWTNGQDDRRVNKIIDHIFTDRVGCIKDARIDMFDGPSSDHNPLWVTVDMEALGLLGVAPVKRVYRPAKVRTCAGDKQSTAIFHKRLQSWLPTVASQPVQQLSLDILDKPRLDCYSMSLVEEALKVITLACTEVAALVFPQGPVSDYEDPTKQRFSRGSQLWEYRRRSIWYRRAVRTYGRLKFCSTQVPASRLKVWARFLLPKGFERVGDQIGLEDVGTPRGEAWFAKLKSDRIVNKRVLSKLVHQWARARSEAFVEAMELRGKLNSKGFRSMVYTRDKPKLQTEVKDKSGFLVTCPEEVKEAIACDRECTYSTSYFSEDRETSGKPWVELPVWSVYRDKVGALVQKSGGLLRHTDHVEFDELIRGTRGGRSPGLCGTTYESIKVLNGPLRTMLINVVNWMLDRKDALPTLKRHELVQLYKKGDRTDLSNYRGLSMLRIPFKLLTAIVTNRKTTIREASGVFMEEQGAARSGRSAFLKAHIATLGVSYAIRTKMSAAVIALDLFKGYDMVTEECMTDACRCLGWGSDYESFVLNINRGVKAKVRTPYGHTREFPYGEGRLKQGCVTSPDLYTDWAEMLLFAPKVCFAPPRLCG